MPKTKFTPGPWSVKPTDTTFNVENDKGTQVVRTSWHDRIFTVYPSKAEAHANVTLIAAAPDMLDALRQAEDALDALRRGYGAVVSGLCYPALNSVRDAIAKAEGRS